MGGSGAGPSVGSERGGEGGIAVHRDAIAPREAEGCVARAAWPTATRVGMGRRAASQEIATAAPSPRSSTVAPASGAGVAAARADLRAACAPARIEAGEAVVLALVVRGHAQRAGEAGESQQGLEHAEQRPGGGEGGGRAGGGGRHEGAAPLVRRA